MQNFNWKKAALFTGAVIGALFIIRLFVTYVLPKSPDVVKKAAAVVLPKT